MKTPTSIPTAAWLILCLWLFLVNRWLRSSGVLAPRLAWFGEFVNAGTAAGIAKILFFVFLVLALISFLSGRRTSI